VDPVQLGLKDRAVLAGDARGAPSTGINLPAWALMSCFDVVEADAG
jgi:hypothetical protein